MLVKHSFPRGKATGFDSTRGQYACTCSDYARRVLGGHYWSFGAGGGFFIITLFDHLESNRGRVLTASPLAPLGRHENGVTNIGYNQVDVPPCFINRVFYV